MKPQRLLVAMDKAQSFGYRRDTMPNINNRWHYHSEIELIYFKCGSGIQFVGDHIRKFKAGDVALIGKNLPHYWKYDKSFFNQKHSIDAYVIHFDENFWGKSFLNLPENDLFKILLQKSKKGIQISNCNKFKIGAIIEALIYADNAKKLIHLLEALYDIACDKFFTLSSQSFDNSRNDGVSDRISNIYDYTLDNFNNPISIQKISSIANLSPHSFCRYFKNNTGKNYSNFLNEIRVRNACNFLIDTKMNLQAISERCGFNNAASFYKHFKRITKTSPLKFQKDFKLNTTTSKDDHHTKTMVANIVD